MNTGSCGSQLEQRQLEMVGQPGGGVTSEVPVVVTACVMDFLLAGAAFLFGAVCDILQWLEKTSWFWFGVHQVCQRRALHTLHLGAEAPIDPPGKAVQAAASSTVARTESRLLQKHIFSWGFPLPFVLLFLLNPAFSGIYVCLFLVYAFFQTQAPF